MEEETYRQPIERTTPVAYPYEFISIAPPPPPESYPQKHKRHASWGHVFVLYTIIALVLIGGSIAYFVLPSLQGKRNTPIPTATPTIQPTKQPYDAMLIIQDFQAHELPLDHLQYGMTVSQFVGSGYTTVITTQSSAEFIDPSFCSGPCDVGSVWLGVYNSPVDAQSEYNGLMNYDATSSQNGYSAGAITNMTPAARCLLIGEPGESEYAAVVRSDCT